MPIATFTDFFVYLESLGIADSLIPFLLIFTVVFAVLEKAKVFGTEPGKKKFNVIVALSMALIVVMPHIMGTYPEGRDAIVIINSSLPNVAVIAIALIMFLFLIGIFGGTAGGLTGIAGLIAMAAIIWIFGGSAGWFAEMPSWLSDPATQTLITIILVFGVVVWFIVGDTGGGTGGVGKIFDWVNERFK